MPKKNNKESYWIEREKDNLTVEMMKDAQVSAEMKRILENAMNTCQKEIESFYARYADKEGVSVAEARKLVSEYDVIAHEAMAKQYVKDKDFSDEANKRLRLYNVSMRINREELLLTALNTHLIAATNDVQHTMDDYLNDGAVRELKRQAGLLGNISVQQKDIHAIVNASYYDATWSERLWDNMDEVRKVVDETVINTVLRGRHPKEGIKRLRELTGRSEYEARRLLISEVSRVQTEAQKISYKEQDIMQYKYLSVIDDRTTDICRGLNGKVFDVADMKVGINAPPTHALCRSTTIPYKRKSAIDWEDKEDGELFIDDEQIEAEADSENDEVLDDIDDIMNRIDKMDNQDTQTVKQAIEKAEQNRPPTLTEMHRKGLNDEQQQKVLEQLNKADRRAVQLFNQYGDVKIVVSENEESAYYNTEKHAIYINPKYMDYGIDGSDVSEYARTLFHEIGHVIDSEYANQIGLGRNMRAAAVMFNDEDESLSDIAAEEWQAIVEKTMKKHSVNEDKAYIILAKKYNAKDSAYWLSISSLVDGVTKGERHFGYGHGPEYWEDDYPVGIEIFAELFSLLITNLKAYAYFASVFPETVAMFERMIKYMLGGGK
ncbi:minor capsid protein [Macrococcus equipercicus]|uniref:Minor capsid protein n=1 Tax=Macrococcus equipercicus TaxID=69967 RepID=A0A9Q9BS86_9STAP|nr:minor capsid protein [Macrococcus equipercicus]UTH14761.1 minor capsid protein [Macrococcus equipercicus]